MNIMIKIITFGKGAGWKHVFERISTEKNHYLFLEVSFMKLILAETVK
jgi:hypothetical protein